MYKIVLRALALNMFEHKKVLSTNYRIEMIGQSHGNQKVAVSFTCDLWTGSR